VLAGAEGIPFMHYGNDMGNHLGSLVTARKLGTRLLRMHGLQMHSEDLIHHSGRPCDRFGAMLLESHVTEQSYGPTHLRSQRR